MYKIVLNKEFGLFLPPLRNLEGLMEWKMSNAVLKK